MFAAADSPLSIRTAAERWEDLSDFRTPPERAPEAGGLALSYPDPPDLIELPRASHTPPTGSKPSPNRGDGTTHRAINSGVSRSPGGTT